MIPNFACLVRSASASMSDPAALERAIAALESCISALNGRVEALEKSPIRWEHLGWWFTSAVALGVLMELWVIRDERKEDWESWAIDFAFGWSRTVIPRLKRHLVEWASVLLVAGGIIGELWVGIMIVSINVQVQTLDAQLRGKNTRLQRDSDQLVALLREQAGDAATSAHEAGRSATRVGQLEQALNVDVAQSELVLAAQASRQRFSLFSFNALRAGRRANIELAVVPGSDEETQWFARELGKGFRRLGWKVSPIQSCSSDNRQFAGVTIFNKWVTTGGHPFLGSPKDGLALYIASMSYMTSMKVALKEGLSSKEALRMNTISGALDATLEKTADLNGNTFCIKVSEAADRWK